MSQGTPAIACIGVIGRHNNPLHIATFPPGQRDELEFQFLLSSSLDIFEQRLPDQSADHDFGLLQALDERIAMYGWVTNTGVKIVIIIDMEGKPPDPNANRYSNVLGVRESDLKPAFRAIQTAYIRLLRNPFYEPDDHSPRSLNARHTHGSLQINSTQFINEVDRIGRTWYPGVQAI
ncbi:MAG: hypothetical protein Q9162_002569 [Coniocarpon cinnabarinum]